MKFLGLLVMLIFASQTESQLNKLRLDVYYESKCPDSRRFIAEQLEPTIDQLGDYISLNLIPFGKAHYINGKFHCQHGDSECRGNMMQDCAINYMQGRSDADILKYVVCEMQTLAGTMGGLQCVRKAGLPVQSVQNCVNSRLGVDLQRQSERLTENVSPAFVPTVTINGRFVQQIQDDSQKDLFGTLCNFVPHTTPCARAHRYH